MNPLIQLKQTTSVFLIAFGLACFGLLPLARAVSPAPDGGYGPPTYGTGNTAEGLNALLDLTTGTYNTANGWGAMFMLSSASNCTAVGAAALAHNNNGENTAVGSFAMASNTSGIENVAVGFQALRNQNGAGFNTAVGMDAMINTNGNRNTGIGQTALFDNTTGFNNTAVGVSALHNNISGSANTGVGYSAGSNITGSGNVCIGANVVGGAGENNTTRIGNIGNTFQNTGIYVTLDSVGGTKLGYVNLSSRRYKDDIKPMDHASDVILALKPVTFRYKKEFDPTHGPGYGLIAEEVEKINPDLVSHNDKGEVMTVRYDAVNAMLLNEFLKQHRTVQEQQKEIDALKTELKEQRAFIQKVNDKVELHKPAPQTVLNNQ